MFSQKTPGGHSPYCRLTTSVGRRKRIFVRNRFPSAKVRTVRRLKWVPLLFAMNGRGNWRWIICVERTLGAPIFFQKKKEKMNTVQKLFVWRKRKIISRFFAITKAVTFKTRVFVFSPELRSRVHAHEMGRGWHSSRTRTRYRHLRGIRDAPDYRPR